MSDVSRRAFLKAGRAVAAIAGVAAVGGPVAGFFYPPNLQEQPEEPVLVSSEEELPVGASTTVPFGRYPALVIHAAGGLRAYSAVCTHFACLCTYEADIGQIACPCHAGFFDPEDGSVISGPPPRPLEKLTVRVIDGKIYVGGEA